MDTQKSGRRADGGSFTHARKILPTRIVVAVVMLCLAGICGYSLRDGGPPVIPRHNTVVDRPRGVAPTRNPNIPVELSYPTIEDVIDPPHKVAGFPRKRTVSIRLNMRVSEDVLRNICLEVKSQEQEQFEFIRINFYLPGQEVGHGCWAIADFDSGLRVTIMGLTIDEERFLLTSPVEVPPGADSLGTWIIEEEFLKHRITIYRTGESWFWQSVSPGSTKPIVHELVQIPSEEGMIFKMSKGSDRYVIDKAGVLRIYGYEDKLISVPRPLSR